MTGTSAYAFHFAPEQGWMNDPNGLIEREGVHHLFFQHNPVAPVFGRMHWGHATSTDLVTWTEQPLALSPGDADAGDADGCWSGCAVTLPDGGVAAVYSAHRQGHDLPALAWALDEGLIRWRKDSRPVVPAWPPVAELTDLRDHAVLRSDSGWRQVLAGGRDITLVGAGGATDRRDGGAVGRGGLLLSYLCEPDLTHWHYDGVLLDGREADLPGEVWECPDVFAGASGDEVVVILSWYTRDRHDPEVTVSDVIWLTGALVGGRFEPRRYGRLDLGDRLYAPQSYRAANGRRLMFGWLRTQQDASSLGQPAVGAASLPRELRVVDGRLLQRPAAEVDALPRRPLGWLGPDSPALHLAQPVSAVELAVEATDVGLGGVAVEFTGADGHAVLISLAAFAQVSSWAADPSGWIPESGASSSARVLVDAGLVEVFTDDGRAAATSELALTAVSHVRLAAAPPGTRIQVSAIGTCPR